MDISEFFFQIWIGQLIFHRFSNRITEKDDSLFKDLRGNFAITSPTNPGQKIGSIEIEILNRFDVQISRIVKLAEEKFQSGELTSPIEEFVANQALGHNRGA